MSDPSIYTVGWICALDTEYLAAKLCLDEEHPRLARRPSPTDTNTYTLGKVRNHNVVIAALPDGSYGTSSAATVAINLLRSFPNVRLGLMVGIGGGAPKPGDVRLGDVVVSSPRGGLGGVFHYDFGKTIQGQDFQETRFLNQPPTALRTGVMEIKVEHKRRPGGVGNIINDILENEEEELRDQFRRPDRSSDRLYKADFLHPLNSKNDCAKTCGRSNLEERPDRTRRPCTPVVHYGLIASGSKLIMDASLRDRLAEKKGVLCFEMEAAGLMNDFPCLVVRGICDYSDTHKNDEWQGYAALAASAYTKDLLGQIPPDEVEAEKRIADIVSAMAIIKEQVEDLSTGVAKVVHEQQHRANQAIITWLAPFDHAAQHNDLIRRWQEGTGRWLLESTEFQAWLNTDSEMLVCHGMPGAGKTVMAAAVINYLQSRFKDDDIVGIGYVYCNFQQQESPETLLISVLAQLTERLSSPPAIVEGLYSRHRTYRTALSLGEISQALHSVTALFSRVFILADALDECRPDVTRTRFLEVIFSLRERARAKIFSTFRFNPEIEHQFRGGTFLEVRAADEDVARYLDGRMIELPTFVRSNPGFCEEIKTEIARRVEGMFLLAKLHFDALVGKISINSIRAALTTLPAGPEAYDESYDMAIERIETQDEERKSVAMQILCWVACARRPLLKSELEHALAVKPGSSSVDEGDIPRMMTSVCAGLVVLHEESRVVRFVHYTMQSYWERRQEHLFPDAEAQISRICGTYLSFPRFESGPCQYDAGFERRLQENPLYDYAALNWGHHARKAASLCQEVIGFLRSSAKVSSSAQALFRHTEYKDAGRIRGAGLMFPKQTTGLHLAAHFGVEQAVRVLLCEARADSWDDYRRTPLFYAAESGNEAVVELLLTHPTVDPDSIAERDGLGPTPLSFAAGSGHERVVETLLATGRVDINSTHSLTGLTPLSYAARNGHEAVVRFLLAADGIDPDPESTPGSGRVGRTPLSLAAEHGHEAVVQLLLARSGVRPDFQAASRGDVDQTPLGYAAENGHEAVVKALLAHPGVDPKRYAVAGNILHPGGYDIGPPLSLAAKNGHDNVVRLLLQNGGSDINFECNGMYQVGRTALSFAAENGHESVVRVLLAADDVDVNWRSTGNELSGQTPLLLAAAEGHRGVVRLLCKGGARLELEDQDGRTPLSWAAGNGHERVVRLLLEEGADIEPRDDLGQTPLSWAMKYGHEDVASLLVENGALLEPAGER